MHFVAALDDVPAMRGVLCLFEGVATGAADGYGRMAGRPAATLLHLGPGPRQRAGQPAQRPPRPHARWSTSSATTPRTTAGYDAPLQSDIERWPATSRAGCTASTRRRDVAADAADAVGGRAAARRARSPP